MGLGYKLFTAGAVLTASDLNNYCQEQSVMYFANTAARDAAISGAALEDGMTVYIGSNDANEGLYTYNGTAWRRPWNMPWGSQGRATTSSTRQAMTASGTDVTGLSVTFDQVSNRLIKFTFMFGVVALTNAFIAFNFTVNTGTTGAGTTVATLGESKLNLGEYQVFSYTATIATTTTGSQSYHLRQSSLSANGISITNDLGLGIMVVEDIGPSGAPV
jgi:hypothetical protein